MSKNWMKSLTSVLSAMFVVLAVFTVFSITAKAGPMLTIRFPNESEEQRTAFVNYAKSQGAYCYEGEDTDVKLEVSAGQTYGAIISDVKGYFDGIPLVYGKDYYIGWRDNYENYPAYWSNLKSSKDRVIDTSYSPSEWSVFGFMYVFWLESTNQVNFTLDTPVCGTRASDLAISFAEGEHAEAHNIKWTGADGTTLKGTINGGDCVQVSYNIYPKFGYIFSDDVKIICNGSEVNTSALDTFENSYFIKKTFTAEHQYEDGICTVCGAGVQPKFTGHSVLLSGQIGLEFWLDLKEIEGVSYDRVELTVPGRNGGKTSIPVADATYDENMGYGFTVMLSALQMAQPVTAELYYTEKGQDKTIKNIHSVEDYIRDFRIEAVEKPELYNQKTQNLVNALHDYGYYVQGFLMDYHKLTPGADTYTRVQNAYENYNFSEYQSVATKNAVERNCNEDIEAVTFSVSFESDTSINVYFKMADGAGAPEVTVDGTSYTPVKCSDGRYKIEIKNIKAQNFSRKYDINALATGSNNGSANVRVSVLSYLDLTYTSENGALNNDKAKNAAISAYMYYLRAFDYLQ